MTENNWLCGEPPEVDTQEIESIENVPTVEDSEKLEEMRSEVEELVNGGEGRFDACMRVAENDLELIILSGILFGEQTTTSDG